MVEKHLKLNVKEEIITGINETYIDARYPADLGLLPSGKPDQNIASEFANAAHSIFKEIKEFLSK